MSHYVLVHGAWEGAWSWEKVVPLLEEKGHQVVTVELPGSSSNRKPVDEVTQYAHVGAVADVFATIEGTVVLVGHSLGGTVISQVAERFPERIQRLVYVTAFLLKSGENALETMQSVPVRCV